jgi:hypothetical protein
VKILLGILGYPNENIMLTIVYLDLTSGYKALDVRNSFALSIKLKALTKKGKFIVCVIDQDSKNLVEQCDGFESHRKFVETCYHLETRQFQTNFLRLSVG